eukprot:3117952-Lingulodinium_polyedra.AAC.1
MALVTFSTCFFHACSAASLPVASKTKARKSHHAVVVASSNSAPRAPSSSCGNSKSPDRPSHVVARR